MDLSAIQAAIAQALGGQQAPAPQPQSAVMPPKAEMGPGGTLAPSGQLPPGADPAKFKANPDGTVSYRPEYSQNQTPIPASYFTSGQYAADVKQYTVAAGPGFIFNPGAPTYEGPEFKPHQNGDYSGEGLYMQSDTGGYIGYSQTEQARQNAIYNAYQAMLKGDTSQTSFATAGKPPDHLGADVMQGLAQFGSWSPPNSDASGANRIIEARIGPDGNIVVTDPRGGDGANPLYIYSPDGKFLQQQTGSKAMSPIQGVASVALAATGFNALAGAAGLPTVASPAGAGGLSGSAGGDLLGGAAGDELGGEALSKAALDGTTSFGANSASGALDTGALSAAAPGAASQEAIAQILQNLGVPGAATAAAGAAAAPSGGPGVPPPANPFPNTIPGNIAAQLSQMGLDVSPSMISALTPFLAQGAQSLFGGSGTPGVGAALGGSGGLGAPGSGSAQGNEAKSFIEAILPYIRNNATGPGGSAGFTRNPDGTFTLNTKLNDQNQNLFDTAGQGLQNLASNVPTSVQALNTQTSANGDLNDYDPNARGLLNGSFGGVPTLQGGMTAQQLQDSVRGNYSTDLAKAIYERTTGLQKNDLADQERKMQARLAEQGFIPQNEGYKNEVNRFEDNRGEMQQKAALDAQITAASQGLQEGKFTNDARTQQIINDIAAGNFNNTAAKDDFTMRQQAGTFSNNATQSNFDNYVKGLTSANDIRQNEFTNQFAKDRFTNDAITQNAANQRSQADTAGQLFGGIRTGVLNSVGGGALSTSSSAPVGGPANTVQAAQDKFTADLSAQQSKNSQINDIVRALMTFGVS